LTAETQTTAPAQSASGGQSEAPPTDKQPDKPTVADPAEATPKPVADAPPLAVLPEVNRGGRPSDHDLLVGEAVRRLKETVPRQLAPFARQIHEWLKTQPDASRDSKGEVARVDTIQDHIRDVFRVATEAERRKAGEAIPSTLAGFAGELRTWLEGHPSAHRSSKTGEVMSVDTIEELVRDRFNNFCNERKK
jgi:hypothetical protein